MNSYIRIRAANSNNYSSKKIAIVGKVVSITDQKVVIDCEDVNNIVVQLIKEIDLSKLKVDDVIEVRGEIMGTMILADDISAYSQNFKLHVYNQALDQLLTC